MWAESMIDLHQERKCIMFQTQYSLPVLEEEQELECQDSDLPRLALSSGPFDDDGPDEDSDEERFEIKAEAEED